MIILAYKRVGWANGQKPYIDAYHLEHMEKGIEGCVCKDADAENIMESPIILRQLNLGGLKNNNEMISKKYLAEYIADYASKNVYSLPVLL